MTACSFLCIRKNFQYRLYCLSKQARLGSMEPTSQLGRLTIMQGPKRLNRQGDFSSFPQKLVALFYLYL